MYILGTWLGWIFIIALAFVLFPVAMMKVVLLFAGLIAVLLTGAWAMLMLTFNILAGMFY